MQKLIYLESTLNLLIQIEGMEFVKELVESGELKKTEQQFNYLLIYESED